MTLPTLVLVGPPRAVKADGRHVSLAAREAALLARLWLDGPCSRAAMAGFLWPRADEARARANLRQTLLRLKRDVGPVLTEADGVLDLVPGTAPPADRADPASTGAVLLGPLEFDDAPELAEWLAERRARIQRDRLRQGLQSAREALDAGRPEAALAAADALLAADPAVEEAHRVRMQVFLARGDRAAAIGAWDECRDALRRAFGIQPCAATAALGRAALSGEGLPDARTAAAAPATTALREDTPFVGRAAALARLHDALRAGHALVVTGAGGIGKTRLLGEHLPEGPATRWVGARPGDEHLAGVWVGRLVAPLLGAGEPAPPVLDASLRHALSGFLPESADAQGVPAASAQDHRQRIAAFLVLLRHLHTRGLRHLVVDDLQWMDALSLEALGAAWAAWSAEPSPALPVPLLACRSGTWRPAVHRLLDSLLASGRCVRVDLAPLQPDDLLPWLQVAAPVSPDHVAALAHALHARVGGNPAFLHDALRALQRRPGPRWQPGGTLPLPDNLVDSVRARLAALPATSLQLAQLAAVAGTDFSLGLAATVCGCPPLALAPDFDRLEQAEVLSAAGFVHDLVAEAVSGSLPETLKGPLHALVADHLAQQDGASVPLTRLAYHRAAAGQRAAAAEAYRRAAEQARRRWRMSEAAEALEAEAALRTGPAERARALMAWRDAARCWLNQGQSARAAEALRQAEARVVDASDRLRVLAARCTLHLNTGDSAALAIDGPALAEALPPREAALDDDELAHALLGVATAAPYVERPEDLLQAIDAMAPRAAGSPRLGTRLGLCAGIVLNWLGWPTRARERLMRAEALADEHALHSDRVNLGNQLARCDEGQGDLDAAIRRCLQTERIVRELGIGPIFEADLANLRGLYEARRGRADRAREALQEARQRLGADGPPSPTMRLREARALAWLGDADGARRMTQALADGAEATARGSHLAFLGWTMAALEHAAGRSAHAWLRRAAPACLGTGTLLALRHQVMCLALGAPEAAQGVRTGLPSGSGPDDVAAVLHERGLQALAAVLSSPGPGRADGRVRAGEPWCDPWVAPPARTPIGGPVPQRPR